MSDAELNDRMTRLMGRDPICNQKKSSFVPEEEELTEEEMVQRIIQETQDDIRLGTMTPFKIERRPSSADGPETKQQKSRIAKQHKTEEADADSLSDTSSDFSSSEDDNDNEEGAGPFQRSKRRSGRTQFTNRITDEERKMTFEERWQKKQNERAAERGGMQKKVYTDEEWAQKEEYEMQQRWLAEKKKKQQYKKEFLQQMGEEGNKKSGCNPS